MELKKKFRFVSKEYTNKLLLKNLDLHLMRMQISFLFKKNSNLHLMKMQIIFFLLKKKYDKKNIFETKKKKEKDLDNKKNKKYIPIEKISTTHDMSI